VTLLLTVLLVNQTSFRSDTHTPASSAKGASLSDEFQRGIWSENRCEFGKISKVGELLSSEAQDCVREFLACNGEQFGNWPLHGLSSSSGKHVFLETGETRTTNTSLRWIIILVRETANTRRHKLQSSKLDTNADAQPYRYLVRLRN
jgi:hypothetical protein